MGIVYTIYHYRCVSTDVQAAGVPSLFLSSPLVTYISAMGMTIHSYHCRCVKCLWVVAFSLVDKRVSCVGLALYYSNKMICRAQ